MKIIGLTGGIGSGKSTASEYLIKKGYIIIDADKIARYIVDSKSNNSVLGELSQVFGLEIINEDGSLNRKKLASVAFSSKEQKSRLDKIMMDKIISIILKELQACNEQGHELAFVDAPLLLEVNLDRYTDEVWVVDVPDEERIKRVMERDGISRDEVVNRINNQMSRADKLKKASHVLDNSSAREALYEQIEMLLGV